MVEIAEAVEITGSRLANRLEKDIKKMTICRDWLLDQYLCSIEKPEWDPTTSMTAVETAGRLHDCDRHITNLQMELKNIHPVKVSSISVEVKNAS